jgi:Uma2 family endonuclease
MPTLAPPLPPELTTPLPDHTQLPCEDGAVHNFLEHPQSLLLTDCLRPVLRARFPDGRYCIGQDCAIYWRITDQPLRGAIAPDWFLVLDVPPTLEGQLRRSYVLWQEHQPPLLVVEFASGDGSEERDRTPETGKFWVYERRVRPAYYAIYEPDAARLEVHHLVEDHFEPLTADAHGRFAVPQLGVALGLWQGTFENASLWWLRWYDAGGELLPTGEERAEQERQRAEQERQRAEQERQRAERLAERLRQLGGNPDEV